MSEQTGLELDGCEILNKTTILEVRINGLLYVCVKRNKQEPLWYAGKLYEAFQQPQNLKAVCDQEAINTLESVLKRRSS